MREKKNSRLWWESAGTFHKDRHTVRIIPLCSFDEKLREVGEDFMKHTVCTVYTLCAFRWLFLLFLLR